jgi:hypothetical protein
MLALSRPLLRVTRTARWLPALAPNKCSQSAALLLLLLLATTRTTVSGLLRTITPTGTSHA